MKQSRTEIERMFRKLLLMSTIVLSAAVLRAQRPQSAVPLDPFSAILDAFQTHAIVALGEGNHNNEQAFRFRLALIRGPRFATVVNDIVVESGSSKHQDVMDRFVRGESVDERSLRRAWQDTTQPDPVWDVPMYEEFFKAVREINQSLPRERQLRVLLGDPPFDWDTATRDDWLRVNRDAFAADLIRREVLAKQRRALVIYGDTHLLKRSTSSLAAEVLAACDACLFSIWTHTSGGDLATLQAGIAAWQRPALALTKMTILGATPFRFYRPVGADGPRMDEQFDAILYLGPVSSITIRRGEISPSLCANDTYMKMRLNRMALIDPPTAAPRPVQSPAERLQQYCDNAMQRTKIDKE
jgi:hypothetical protein